MNYRDLSDQLLVKLVSISDDKAFEEIYRRYWKHLFNAAYFRVRSKEIAKEIIQNIFLSVWEKRETASIEHLETYLHTAVKYRVINYIESQVIEKKYSLFVKHQQEENAGASDATLLMDELNKAIEKVMLQLPEKTQQIFRLSRFDHLSTREIAQNIGLTEKAVEYHLTKSLKALRLHLKEYIYFIIILCAFLP